MSQEGAAIESMDGTLEGLRRLSETLVALSSVSRSDVVLSRCRPEQDGPDGRPRHHEEPNGIGWTHYRVLPPAVRQSYELLASGAQLVHATSTKYSLMAKIDLSKSREMASDLFRGCSWVGTSCLVLHDQLAGSARRHALSAGRNVVRSVLQLLEEEVVVAGIAGAAQERGAVPNQQSALAQRTGVVWESCDVILNRQLPLGNRNAMRRDLLGYMKECQETIEEFQAMIDLGPQEGADSNRDVADTANEGGGGDDDEGNDNDETEWEAFLDGHLDRYRPEEIAAVVPCVALVRCSRGTLNWVLQALDVLGGLLSEAGAPSAPNDGSTLPPPQLTLSDRERLGRMGRLHELACRVGVGMTDLGATLYPPLDADAVGVQVLWQARAIQTVLRTVMSEGNDDENDDEVATALEDQGNLGAGVEWPAAVVELHQKLTSAVVLRQAEALEALVEAQDAAAPSEPTA